MCIRDRFQTLCEDCQTKKGACKKNKTAWQELATKILNCTEEQQQKIAASKVVLPSGTRVRVGTDKGEINWALQGGAQYCIVLDKVKAAAKVACHTMEQKKPSEFQVLCSVCDNEDGTKYCGKCKVQFYCSRDCQKKGWSKHKKSCGKKDDSAFTFM